MFLFLYVVVFGSQRALLQLLFGAGIVLLAARRSAAFFYRRTALLIGFGLIDVFVLLWPGDILVVYGVAAMLVYPLQRLRARWLLMLTSLHALWVGVAEWPTLTANRAATHAIAVAEAHRVAGAPLSPADRAAIAAERVRRPDAPLSAGEIERGRIERAARRDGVVAYASDHWHRWLSAAGSDFALVVLGEAASTIVLGMALCKLGVFDPARGRRFFAWLAASGFAVAILLRLPAALGALAFRPDSSIDVVADEVARIAAALGFTGAIGLALRTGWPLRALRAAGRGAFSIYLAQSLVCQWLVFAPWGPGLWNRFHWAGLAVVAATIDVLLLGGAAWWFARRSIGPLEWVWRSLSHGRRQSWRAAPVLPA